MNDSTPKKRGGARDGAGRKPMKPEERKPRRKDYGQYRKGNAYLTPEMWAALETEAARLNSTVPELMRTVLRAWLEGMATKCSGNGHDRRRIA